MTRTKLNKPWPSSSRSAIIIKRFKRGNTKRRESVGHETSVTGQRSALTPLSEAEPFHSEPSFLLQLHKSHVDETISNSLSVLRAGFHFFLQIFEFNF